MEVTQAAAKYDTLTILGLQFAGCCFSQTFIKIHSVLASPVYYLDLLLFQSKDHYKGIAWEPANETKTSIPNRWNLALSPQITKKINIYIEKERG